MLDEQWGSEAYTQVIKYGKIGEKWYRQNTLVKTAFISLL